MTGDALLLRAMAGGQGRHREGPQGADHRAGRRGRARRRVRGEQGGRLRRLAHHGADATRGRARGAVFGAGVDHGRVTRLEAQDEVADVDLVAFANDGRLRDLAAVDVSAVGAFEIGDDEAPVAKEEPGMVLRHVALGEHQVIALHPPHVDLVPIEGLATFGSPLLADDDREHSVFFGGHADHRTCVRRPFLRLSTTRRANTSATGGIVEGGPQACQLQEIAKLPVATGACLALLAAVRRTAASPELARHLSQELAGERDDVSRFETAAPELAVDRSRQDGECTGITRAGGFAEREGHGFPIWDDVRSSIGMPSLRARPFAQFAHLKAITRCAMRSALRTAQNDARKELRASAVSSDRRDVRARTLEVFSLGVGCVEGAPTVRWRPSSSPAWAARLRPRPSFDPGAPRYDR